MKKYIIVQKKYSKESLIKWLLFFSLALLLFVLKTNSVSAQSSSAGYQSAKYGGDIVEKYQPPPQLNCANDTTVYTNTTPCEANVVLNTPSVVFTLCPEPANSPTNSHPATYPIGTTDVTWTVTTINGKTATCVQHVTVVNNLSSSTSATDVFCSGSANGTATATVSGGSSPYSYSWNIGSINPSITGLTAGVYTVFITDASGCSTTNSVTVSEPNEMLVSYSITNMECNTDDSEGEIEIEVEEGLAPYSYIWSNGATGAVISGLSAATYTVTITDSNGCYLTKSYSVSKPPPIISSSAITSANCNGNSDGSIIISPTGGIAPYTYLWSDFDTNKDRSNMSAGVYTVVISDANLCTQTSTVVIDEPVLLSGLGTISNVQCRNSSTGSINVVATGGTSPYSYLWNNGATIPNRSNLSAGIYTVTITDSHGCISTNSYSISQPATSMVINIVKTNVRCGGFATGHLQAIPVGGITPYSYLWNTGVTSDSPGAIPASTYTVTVTDAAGCVKAKSTSITQNPTLVLVVVPVSGNIAIANVSGGVPGYSYSWNTSPIQTTSTANGLIPGHTYKVKVTDSKGCTKIANITMPIPRIPNSLSSGLNITAYPNPAQEYVTLQFENATVGTNYEVTFSNMVGEEVLQTEYKASSINGTQDVDVGKLSTGIYNLTIQSDAIRKNIRLVIN